MGIVIEHINILFVNGEVSHLNIFSGPSPPIPDLIKKFSRSIIRQYLISGMIIKDKNFLATDDRLIHNAE